VFLSAALGAVVSSTATTAALASRSREAPDLGRTLAAAAVLASTVMCLRICVLVAVVGPTLLSRVGPAMGTMAAVGTLATLLISRGTPGAAEERTDPPINNPFSLRAAMVFGAVYAGTVLLVRGAQAWLGTTGTLLASGISGLVDVDAITLAIARGGAKEGPAAAAVGIVIACASNNLFKVVFATARGAGRFRRDFSLAVSAMTLAGGAAAALTLRFL
jgi:uncharacterized membrane protein (DUF4010 family)